MSKIQLLDCTLRDGGFINDWKFGRSAIRSIARGAIAAGTDIVELGFIDARRDFDSARSIFPDTAGIEKTFADICWEQTMPVAMIDYGTCPLSHISLKKDSLLTGIRVIFKKDACNKALDFCADLQARGYLVFAQPVSVTSYTEDELLHLLSLINALHPTTVSIVDTYGLLREDALLYYFSLFDNALAPDIGLGFHAHNNMQLAFSNCLALLRSVKNSGCNRELTLDGSILGMGKSAGNAPLELLAAHLNSTENTAYALKPLLSVADSIIAPINGEPRWGYSLPFFLAAIAACHPQYVFCLTRELDVNIADTLHILQMLEADKRLVFDKNHLIACINTSGIKIPASTGEKV